MEKREEEKSPFRELHHVTIVVKDMEQAIEYYSSLGIGPFIHYTALRDYVQLSNVPDKEGLYNIIVREAQIGPVILQLVQPGEGKSIYKDFLEKRGEGVQHLGFVVDDIDKEEAKVKKLGFKSINSGRRTDGSGFSYFDNDRIGGVHLLIRQNPSKK